MKPSESRSLRGLKVAAGSAVVVALLWFFGARAFGDRSTSMTVLVSVVGAAILAAGALSRSVENRSLMLSAGFGAVPVVAFAALRAMSDPLMGVVFPTGTARDKEGVESLLLAIIISALCGGIAALFLGSNQNDRSGRGRFARWGVWALAWSPILVVPAVLGLALAQGLRTPGPSNYGRTQPLLGHISPPEMATSPGDIVVDEVASKRGVTLVRICEDRPWCVTVLRRGRQVTTQPGKVARDAPVHLRYDPKHDLYLVESAGRLVGTTRGEDFSSYAFLLPHHVRRSVAPPHAFTLLALLSVLLLVVFLVKRRRIRSQAKSVAKAEAGVCFGNGWGLMADGTTMRVPEDMKHGSILMVWSGRSGRTMELIEGTREELELRMQRTREALDRLQFCVSWTLCAPLLVSLTVV